VDQNKIQVSSFPTEPDPLILGRIYLLYGTHDCDYGFIAEEVQQQRRR
jgi:hypothetical protein